MQQSAVSFPRARVIGGSCAWQPTKHSSAPPRTRSSAPSSGGACAAPHGAWGVGAEWPFTFVTQATDSGTSGSNQRRLFHGLSTQALRRVEGRILGMGPNGNLFL